MGGHEKGGPVGLGRLKVVSLADNESAIQAEDDWTDGEIARTPAVLAAAVARRAVTLWMPMIESIHPRRAMTWNRHLKLDLDWAIKSQF